MDTEHEIIHRIHFDKHFLEVGTSPDNPDYIHLRTVGAKNIEFFGQLDLPLAPEAALKLGNALVAKANEMGVRD